MQRLPRTGRRLRGWLLGIAVSSLVLGGAAQAAETQAGVWQSHKLTLYFLGISTVYSCEGLKDALTYLLHQVGGRLDGPVVPQPCLRGYGTPERLTQAQLDFASLKPLTTQAGSAEVVPGTWRHVQISSQGGASTLHGSDCELANEFREEVLPLFAVRNIKSHLNCVPFQDTSLVFGLSFEVFVPASAVPTG